MLSPVFHIVDPNPVGFRLFFPDSDTNLLGFWTSLGFGSESGRILIFFFG